MYCSGSECFVNDIMFQFVHCPVFLQSDDAGGSKNMSGFSFVTQVVQKMYLMQTFLVFRQDTIFWSQDFSMNEFSNLGHPHCISSYVSFPFYV